MQDSFSPILLKVARQVAGEVAGEAKRTFQAPTHVYLDDWWLSKPNRVDGIAVGGRLAEMRRCDNLGSECENSTPAKLRAPLREFKSSEVVKRRSSTEVETSDGVFVYLCGLINMSRAKENGFSSEVLRHFVYGFPFNWKDYASAESVSKSSQRNHDHFTERIIPAALNTYSGAQLHDMVLTLTDAEREILNKKMCNDLMAMLNPETASENSTEAPSKPNPPPFVEDKIPLTPVLSKAKVKNNRKVQTTPLKKDKQREVSDLQTSRKRAREVEVLNCSMDDSMAVLNPETASEKSTKAPFESESEANSDVPPAKVKPIESKPMDLKKNRSVIVLASPAVSSAKRRGGPDSKGKGTASKNAKVEKVEGGSHDESKKPLFQRLWSDDDEVEILKGLIEFKANPDGFLEFVKKSLHVDASKGQIMRKVRALKKRFANAKKKTKIVDPHGVKLFEMSKKVWEDDSGAVSNATKDSKKKVVVEKSKVANGSVVSEEEEDEEEDEKELKLEDLGNSLFLRDGFLKQGMNLLDAEEKAQMAVKWKNHNLKEMELYVKRLDLLKELTQKTLNAING